MQPNNKQKSGIPLAVSKRTGSAGSNSDQNTARSQHGTGDGHQNHTSSRDHPVAQASTQNPLAPLMAKKKTTKKNQITESWADQKSESQSLKSRSQIQSDSVRRKEDMERQLEEAESQLGAMSDLIKEREKWLEEVKNAADNKIGELEDRLIHQEGVLAEHGIDPVSGQQLPVSEENKAKVEASKKITKKTVQTMREKLREMNRQTEGFLADIENTMQYLASLEASSERAGPFSEETQAMIARLGGDEDAIGRVYDENVEKKDTPDQDASDNDKDGNADDSEEEKDEDSKDDGTHKEPEVAQDASKFFITDASADGVTDVIEGENQLNQADTG